VPSESCGFDNAGVSKGPACFVPLTWADEAWVTAGHNDQVTTVMSHGPRQKSSGMMTLWKKISQEKWTEWDNGMLGY
jgi:hypothetical protein